MPVWHSQLFRNSGDAMTGMNPSQAHDQFAELFVRNQRRIYTYVSTLLTNREDVEDIFQQTCVLLWKKWGQFSADADFGSWACGIARNEVRNFLRVRRTKPAFSEHAMEELSRSHESLNVIAEERHKALADCLSKLPAQQRELIERYYQGNSTVARIAEQVRLAPAALYKRLHRTRRALFDCINMTMGKEGAR